jgi:RNA polymerase sigma-70 factor (ECF subfamily)
MRGASSDPDVVSDSSILPALSISAVSPSDVDSPLEAEVVELFDRWSDRLLRYLLSFGLTTADSEEVVQETFLALFQHLRRGKPKHNLKGWLFRVAHNLALKKRQQAKRDSQTCLEAPTLAAQDTVVDPSPNPEAQSIQNQTQKRLWAVVSALPEQDRRCLALRAEGLRYREIASVLDISLGAVSLSLGRSLARIARAAER